MDTSSPRSETSELFNEEDLKCLQALESISFSKRNRTSIAIPQCENCGKRGAQVPCTYRCNEAFYCDNACMLNHAKFHRRTCSNSPATRPEDNQSESEEDGDDEEEAAAISEAAEKRIADELLRRLEKQDGENFARVIAAKIKAEREAVIAQGQKDFIEKEIESRIKKQISLSLNSAPSTPKNLSEEQMKFIEEEVEKRVQEKLRASMQNRDSWTADGNRNSSSSGMDAVGPGSSGGSSSSSQSISSRESSLGDAPSEALPRLSAATIENVNGDDFSSSAHFRCTKFVIWDEGSLGLLLADALILEDGSLGWANTPPADVPPLPPFNFPACFRPSSGPGTETKKCAAVQRVVDPQSCAGRAQICVGDVLQAVNGVDMSEVAAAAVLEMLGAMSGPAILRFATPQPELMGEYTVEWQSGPLGLTLKADNFGDSVPIVHRLTHRPGSLSSLCNIAPADILMAIDDLDMVNAGYSNALQLLRQGPPAVLRFRGVGYAERSSTADRVSSSTERFSSQSARGSQRFSTNSETTYISPRTARGSASPVALRDAMDRGSAGRGSDPSWGVDADVVIGLGNTDRRAMSSSVVSEPVNGREAPMQNGHAVGCLYYLVRWEQGSLGLSLQKPMLGRPFPYVSRITGKGTALGLEQVGEGDALVAIGTREIQPYETTDTLAELRSSPKPVTLKFMQCQSSNSEHGAQPGAAQKRDSTTNVASVETLPSTSIFQIPLAPPLADPHHGPTQSSTQPNARQEAYGMQGLDATVHSPYYYGSGQFARSSGGGPETSPTQRSVHGMQGRTSLADGQYDSPYRHSQPRQASQPPHNGSARSSTTYAPSATASSTTRRGRSTATNSSTSTQDEYVIVWSDGPLGITFGHDGARPFIKRLLGQGAAKNLPEQAQGDLLLAINNSAVASVPFPELMQRLKALPKPVKLLFRATSSRGASAPPRNGEDGSTTLRSSENMYQEHRVATSLHGHQTLREYSLIWAVGALGLTFGQPEDSQSYPYIKSRLESGAAAQLPASVVEDFLVAVDNVDVRQRGFTATMHHLKTANKPMTLRFRKRVG